MDYVWFELLVTSAVVATASNLYLNTINKSRGDSVASWWP